jgi:hypothetical protein
MAIKKRKTTPVSTQDAIAELFNKLHDAGCDPIKELADMAMDPATPRNERIAILKDLAQYTSPKRRAVDVTTSQDSGVVVKIVKYSKDVNQARNMMKPSELKKEMEVPSGQQKETAIVKKLVNE